MAVPKKRVSKQRKRKRRTHYKAEAVTTQSCARCGDPKLPHRVCPTCGFYRDEAVIEVELD
jgi:large subunit ribosomal protein L32